MPPFDGEKFGLEIVAIVKAYCEPIRAELEALRQVKVIAGKDGSNGKDGKDGANGIDGKAGAAGRDGAAGERGPPGASGVDGKDGAQGIAGRDGLQGRDGKDGKDGLAIDDVTETLEQDGRILLRQYWRDGELVKEFRHVTASIIDRGVWQQRGYLRGDCVSLNGCMWIAQDDTERRPSEPESGWRLAVKRGRDGKAA